MRTCSAKYCQRPRWARDWCQKHYARWYRRREASVSKRAYIKRSDFWENLEPKEHIIITEKHGGDTEYRKLHYWVERNLGKPMLCWDCGKTEGIFHWANISQQYLREIKDWERLCAKCHKTKSVHRKNQGVMV